MSNNPDRWQGLGITRDQLKPGTAVMVPVGTIAAQVNGWPCTIAYAEVMGPAGPEEASVYVNPEDVWWLNVHMGPGLTLPQMYRADQILGVPATGLTMADGPNPLDEAVLGKSG
jgi:hypothetical protein